MDSTIWMIEFFVQLVSIFVCLFVFQGLRQFDEFFCLFQRDFDHQFFFHSNVWQGSGTFLGSRITALLLNCIQRRRKILDSSVPFWKPQALLSLKNQIQVKLSPGQTATFTYSSRSGHPLHFHPLPLPCADVSGLSTDVPQDAAGTDYELTCPWRSGGGPPASVHSWRCVQHWQPLWRLPWLRLTGVRQRRPPWWVRSLPPLLPQQGTATSWRDWCGPEDSLNREIVTATECNLELHVEKQPHIRN